MLNPTKNDTISKRKEKDQQEEIKLDLNEMVRVPAGNFIMGSNNAEIDERPVHIVFLDEYWINKYPITNEQYVSFLNSFLETFPERQFDIENFIHLEKKQVKIRFINNRFVTVIPYGKHPVTNVTWFGASEYAKFYNKRLPTEAEWEKAARGIDGNPYPWGEKVDSSFSNYWDSKDPFENGTSSVGFYNGQLYFGFQTSDSQSPFKVYDMVGNVKEWVSDWYKWNYYSMGEKINPRGPVNGDKKIVRGGGFLFHAEDLRTTLRNALEPNKSKHYIGFRCVTSVNPIVAK